MDMAEAKLLVFEMEIPIRWGDMDAMRHVNNTIYFRYMEQTRISWFDHCGFQPDPSGQGPVIINANCTFIQQFEYPGVVLCRHYVGKIGNSSFETIVEMTRTDDSQKIYAQGGAKCVWVDFPKQKSLTLPESAREMIQRPWRPI
jgi:acyl-CoA thioester hydrolase